MSSAGAETRLDLRVTGSALAAWLVTGVGLGLPVAWTVGSAAVLLGLGMLVLRGHRSWAAVAVTAAAAGLVTALHAAALTAGPISDLATQRAVVTVDAVLTSDPVLRPTRYGSVTVVELRVESVTGRGEVTDVRTPVLVFADPSWADLAMGTRIRAVGELTPAADQGLAAVLSGPRLEAVLDDPAWWWRGSSAVRASVRVSVDHVGDDPAALVPALVDGDDGSLSEETKQEFQVTGLTHLLAVSGTNLTLVVGFLLGLARLVGVRGYAQVAVGVAGTVGFVLLARPDPSVLRAAAMGLVALSALGAGGRRRGIRVLSVAVLGLLLVAPGLAREVGFALSVLATAGIVLLAPGWREAMARWLPRWLAEALAVPMAAQMMCTPLVAAISGQVSLVAVAANLLAAPAVGPATVLGLAAGLLGLAVPALGTALGTVAGGAGWWVVEVADTGASVATPALDWGSGAGAIAVLSLGCLGAVALAPVVLRSRWAVLALVTVTVPVVLGVSPPAWVSGWPPDGWVMVACDVGQGDGLVLNAGERAAVVVDTGPSPEAMDGCLDRLGIISVPLVVLTHPHADHVSGLAGVGDGRTVGAVEVTTVAGSPATSDVAATAEPVGVAVAGERGRVGGLTWEVLGPLPSTSTISGEEGSAANDASIVMRVETAGISVLLTGDVEPPAQEALLAWGERLDVDVLKVPHHGSRFQDPTFLTMTSPEIAVVSVGADNDYGHPAAETVATLTAAGAEVVRTDLSGDVAVVVDNGRISVQTR